MNIINVDRNNIEIEHICCAISDKKSSDSKKIWMKEQFENGLVFKKLDERGKVFIEYIPAEYAFAAIDEKNYIYINCFWVSGKYKGQGYGNRLLEECIEDAKRKKKSGIVVLSSVTKKPFLSEPKYFKYKGFKVADTASPYYELLYLPFEESEEVPKFRDSCKTGKIEDRDICIYYTNQCPHTEKYTLLLKDTGEAKNVNIKLIKLDSLEKAKRSPNPFTTYSMFYNGEFVTNEIFSEKKLLKFLEEKIL